VTGGDVGGDEDAGALLDLAVRAARRGRDQIARRDRPVRWVRHKSTATDPVTDADLASQTAITRLIVAERPGDGLLCEEGADRPADSGLRWVVDSLDGTVNHLYRIPHSAVSIACERLEEHGWRTIVAAVHDIPRGETFTAVRGRGALLDESVIVVNDPVALPSALIATEFSYDSRSRSRQASVLAAVLPRARDIRSSGSSALDLCWTAAGRCDGFYEDELSRWDWSAGALIVEEAGGLVSALDSGVVAAGPALHRELRAVLRRD
jgi:myo-inositol-1(or 4)-monophosphatase